MPRGAASSDLCRRCEGKFGVDIDPSDPGQAVLKRRCLRAAVCKPCYHFKQHSDEYVNLSDSQLEKQLEGPAEKAKYMNKRHDWCEERKNGKRRLPKGDFD